MDKVITPRWTILYNIVCGDGFIGMGWEFFTDEKLAQARYDELNIGNSDTTSGKYCATKRPYHKDDAVHLGAAHQELRKSNPAITIKTSDFKPINGSIVGMGAERIEYEGLLAWALNTLIEGNLPLDTPLDMKYDHNEMERKGYLKKHSDKMYSLTLKSIGILKTWQDSK
jgi:hypothetical protein